MSLQGGAEETRGKREQEAGCKDVQFRRTKEGGEIEAVREL